MTAPTTMGIALLAGLVIGGCSDDDDTSTSQEEVTTTAPSTTPDDGSDRTGAGADPPTTSGAADPADDPGDSAISANDGVLTDGRWAVGEAGTVEFAVRDGRLELIDAAPNEGWQMTVDEQSADEIEVDFERDNLEYEIEVQYANGILEVEIDLDIDPAAAGSFDIGPAGVATISEVDGRVALDGLTPSEGWTVVEQDTNDGEVEIELRQGEVTWEFDAEIDDDRIEVEIDFEIEGAYP